MSAIPDILRKIVEHKRDEVEAARRRLSLEELRARAAAREEQPRGFATALKAASSSRLTAVIAEVKKGSPSKGVIRPDFDPVTIAGLYETNGAACLSVLTDERFFLGSLRYLQAIREEISLPLLRKDFLYDAYQVYEAAAFGADAVLLIMAMLDLQQVRDLAGLAAELGLDVLLEVHDERELETALQTDIPLIGINNRNLRTFVTDLGTTGRLARMLPPGRFAVAESGINTRADVVTLQQEGAQAFLIGESLMRESDIGKKLRELLGETP